MDECCWFQKSTLYVNMCVCVSAIPFSSGKLPIQVEDDDAQQVFTTTAFELPQPEEETSRMSNYNSSQNLDKLAPPLPPKPLAG